MSRKNIVLLTGKVVTNQKDFTDITTEGAYATHVSYFWWVNHTDYVSGTANYQPWAGCNWATGTVSENDTYWCGEEYKLDIDGTSSLYALSYEEMAYMLNLSGKTSGARTGNRFAMATVDGSKGLLVFPDGYDASSLSNVNSTDIANISFEGNTISASDFTTMENAGVVFLPCTGRIKPDNDNTSQATKLVNGRTSTGGELNIWTSTPSEAVERTSGTTARAHYLIMTKDDAQTSKRLSIVTYYRDRAYPLRLVK